MEFDPDAWAELAKSDPVEFERRRERMLRRAIDRAPPAFRERMESLQRSLDLERERSATPVASRARMNTLMWAGLYRLRKELTTAQPGGGRREVAPTRTAQIIPLRSRRRT